MPALLLVALVAHAGENPPKGWVSPDDEEAPPKAEPAREAAPLPPTAKSAPEAKTPQAAPLSAPKRSSKKSAPQAARDKSPRGEQTVLEAAERQLQFDLESAQTIELRRKLGLALTLQPIWDGTNPIELGTFDPRRQQIAVRGSLAVAATVDKLLVIDAAAGEVVRSLDLQAPRPVPPYGVLLDGDFAVYATDDGYVAKLGLDGAYAFMERVGTSIQAGPMLFDLDSDGTTDAVVIVAARASMNSTHTVVLALDLHTGAPLFEDQLSGAPLAPSKRSLVREGANAFQLFSDGATHRYKLTKEDGLTHFLPTADDSAAEISDLVVAETVGSQFLYIRHTEGGTAFSSSLESLSPAGVDTKGDAMDWKQVSTVSVEDVDGNGFWDVLAVRDGKLEAYHSGLTGKLYQRQPFDARTPQHRFDDYILPGAGDNADRFRALAATSFEGFRSSTARNVEPLFATRASHQTIALHRRPLLLDAQRNSSGEYAHDGAQLFAWSSKGGFESRPLAAVGDAIKGLAVAEAHVAIAYQDKLAVCDAAVSDCRGQPFDFSGHPAGVVRGSSESRFWIATREGSLVSYDVETRRFTRAQGVKQLGRIDRLSRLGDSIIATGPQGTTVYAADGGRLAELTTLQPALEQVVQCSRHGTYYARSGGELLEAASVTGPFELVQSQPSAIRALACDPSGALVVLSATSGPLALRGPMYFAWPEGLIAVMASLGVLLFVVGLSYRRPKRDEQQLSAASEPVRLGIRADLPLTTLPRNTDSKLRGLVNALVRFIDNADTQPPITIGIYGPWGSGKSSAMRLVKHELEAKRRYISVWFNPWRFHREKDIAAALLQSVVQEVRERAGLGRINIALQRLVRVPALLKLAWFVPLVGISLHALCYPHMYPPYLLSQLVKELLPTELAGRSLLTISGVAGLVRFIQVARNVFKLNPADLLGEKNQEARVDFIRHFSDELAQVLDALPRAQQVVIFVDDLDRCPPDQTLEILEALQLLTESQRCYFVLGMDQTMVRYAIELKYQSLLELKQKHGEDITGFGAHYLEKIITLAVHVPLVRATEIEEETRSSAAQLAALARDESRAGSLRGRPSPSQVFLLAWLLLCFLGFSFLFSMSGPVRDTQTSTSAATDPKDPAAAPQAGTSKTVVQPSAAVEAPAQVQQVQSAADLAKNAKELPRERPPAAVTPSAATSARSADHVYRQSRNALLGVLSASFAACMILLAIAALLYYRLRSIGPVGSPAKDSPEFNAALRVYLAHLPQNPRKLIRSGNVARFMYYLLGSGWPGCSPATFFACLLAEQYLRPIVGEARDAGELAWHVMVRKQLDVSDGATATRLNGVFDAWRSADVPLFHEIGQLDAAFCNELRSWLRGATTA